MDLQPIDGVAVWTSTGRGEHLDSDARKSVINAWRETMGSDRLIVATVGPGNRTDPNEARSSALEMLVDAGGYADFVLVQPPVFSGNPENIESQVLDFHRAIAEQGVPLFVSSSCQKSGMICTQAMMDQLLSMPQVAGIVASTPSFVDLQETITYVRMRHPSKAILAGENRLMGYSLYRGCHGALAGLGGICPVLQRTMIDAWFMGETTRFLEMSRLVDHLAEAVFIEPFESHIKKLLVGLAHQGIVPADTALDPWGAEITAAEEEYVLATLDALNEWAYA